MSVPVRSTLSSPIRSPILKLKMEFVNFFCKLSLDFFLLTQLCNPELL